RRLLALRLSTPWDRTYCCAVWIGPSLFIFFFSSRRRHTSSKRDWSSDVCSSDLERRVRSEWPATCCPSPPRTAGWADRTRGRVGDRTAPPGSERERLPFPPRAVWESRRTSGSLWCRNQGADGHPTTLP